MLKTQLAHRGAEQNPHLYQAQVDAGVSAILHSIAEALARRGPVELPGMGRFPTKTMLGRRGRDPRTGAGVDVPEKAVIVFCPGRDMHRRLNPDSERLIEPYKALASA